MTLLGYYGLPWWFAWPALQTMQSFGSADRVTRTLIFVLAVFVNTAAWAIVFLALGPLVKRVNFRRRPVVLLLAGIATLFGYYGMPWWLGLPAQWTLQSFGSGERPIVVQTAIFIVAVLVNVAAWTIVFSGLSFLGERANVRDHVANLFRRQ